MFKRNQKEIKELAKKCGRLEKQIEDIEKENAELKQIRLLEVRNSTKIQDQNVEKDKLIKNIKELLGMNKYGNERMALNKIKELISDFDSQN